MVRHLTAKKTEHVVMRKLRPGSIHHVMQKVVEAGGGLEAVGAEIGVSPSTVSRAVGEPETRPGGLGVVYLATLGRIVPETAEPVANHFASLAGGSFQPFPKGNNAPVGFHNVAKKFGDVATSYGIAHSQESLDPSRLTHEEAVKLRQEVRELLQVGALFLASLDQIIEN